MKKQRTLIGTLTLALLVLALAVGPGQAQEPEPQEGVSIQAALGTAFTYQGRLTDGGSPANGDYDFEFRLYDAASGGTQVGGPLTVNDETVSDGLFTVELDFCGGAFHGEARYLEIGVRPGASTGAYTTLSPRQALTPAPYALALPGLWTQQNGTSPNLIGGYSGNSVTAGVVGAAIGGGGSSDYFNRVTDDYGTVGGGVDNAAGNANADPTDARHATVAGGSENYAAGPRSTIGGGSNNTSSADHATVGGGYINTANSSYATVGGGRYNDATGPDATVGGGYDNLASSSYATVGGGRANEASEQHATVGGGINNTASGMRSTVGGGEGNTASGYRATVPGGIGNWALGDHSFAAGRQARAYNQGCFVWGDSTDDDVSCSNDNRWVARASGGVYFYTKSNLSTGAYLAANSGTWSSVSDRNVKENIEAVEAQGVLERLVRVPVSTWNYIGEEEGIRHMGPMAQDFYAAFGLGDSERHIATIDADGVALVAIQGLYQRVQALEAENAAQQEQIDDLEARVAALEAGSAGPVQADLLPGVGLLLVGLAWFRRGAILKLLERGGR